MLQRFLVLFLLAYLAPHSVFACHALEGLGNLFYLALLIPVPIVLIIITTVSTWRAFSRNKMWLAIVGLLGNLAITFTLSSIFYSIIKKEDDSINLTWLVFLLLVSMVNYVPIVKFFRRPMKEA